MFEKRNRQSAKMTAEQVGEIRQHYAEGATQRDIGEYYGLSTVQVGRIVRRESWRGSAGSGERSQSDVDKSQGRLLAMMGVGSMDELVGLVPTVAVAVTEQPPARQAPRSLLDGGDGGDDSEPTGLSQLEQHARDYGLDIDKLRAGGAQ